MSADPNKKSARTFQCRDVLWETFEQLARELECSVDYLINEAMKHYARQRAQGAPRTPYPGREASQPQATQVAAPVGAVPVPAPLKPPPAARPPAAAAPATSLPLPPARVPPPAARPATSSAPVPPPRSGVGPITRPPVAPPPIPGAAPVVPPPIPGTRSVPPPITSPGVATRSVSAPPPRAPVGATNGFPPPATHSAALTLVYNGDRYPITKERFVIGRGKQSSDLTLKDPNVSRQHALVELQNGQYFMVDMGSTNGVAYNGQRIARKPIVEGDVFRICDHDLLFTYS
jgi:hypothetical protein